jgi:hypothetical protein
VLQHDHHFGLLREESNRNTPADHAKKSSRVLGSLQSMLGEAAIKRVRGLAAALCC